MQLEDTVRVKVVVSVIPDWVTVSFMEYIPISQLPVEEIVNLFKAELKLMKEGRAESSASEAV